MKITSINATQLRFSGKTFSTERKTATKNNSQNLKTAKPKTVSRDVSKELAAIQALNGFGFSDKKSLSVKELAEYVEHSINSGLEEKLLEYHKTVLDSHKINRHKDHFDFEDKKGRKYSALHNFNPYSPSSFYTIQVEQEYDGIPYDSKIHYEGYPNGKLPNPNHQTGFIYPHTKNGEIEYIKYELRDYNLDDEHGYTDAIIDADGTIKSITTGYDMLVSPIKIKYDYENGILKSAAFLVYNNGYEGREAICTFNEHRKVKQIYYPEAKDKYGKILPEETYKKDNSGKFILKSDK